VIPGRPSRLRAAQLLAARFPNIVRLTLLASIVCLAPAPDETGEAAEKICRKCANGDDSPAARIDAVASFALAAPAGAQFAHGPAPVDQVRGIERAQFRDFWDDRGWSYRNNSPGSFWGDRRPSYPNRSYDPYSPYRRQQVYESIKPPAPHKTETPPAETVVVIGDSFAEWLAYGLEQVFAETP
jgi:hypothetical protein